MLKTLSIGNYRSLLNLTIPLGRLNVITGANGCGKSNLYRALRLLAETAQSGVINAFPGANLRVISHEDGRFSLEFSQHGLLRPLSGAELYEPAWHWPDKK